MNEQHTTAQELSARAASLLAEGQAEEAQRLFAEAAKYEEKALASIPPGRNRTRSVLCVSVASLLYKGALLDEAERAIFVHLAAGELDGWADAQLRELLQVVSDERLVMTTLARRYSGETITVALLGGEIGVGTAPFDLFLDKAAGFRSLLYRMAEWVGQFPLRRHGLPPDEVRDLVQARATEAAAGSYRLEIRLTEPAQRDLLKPTRVPPGELSERLFNFLERLTAPTDKDLKGLEDLVPQPEYRSALLQLTRNIVPSGKRLDEIGIYRKKQDRLQRVYLTGALRPRIRDAIPRPPKSPTEEETSHRGILRALHLDQDWLELKLEDGTPLRCETVPEMLDDVVGPMVNRLVLVTGHTRKSQGKNRLLASEIELVEEE